MREKITRFFLFWFLRLMKGPKIDDAARLRLGHNDKILIDLFKIVNDHYRNDINSVWQRSHYFLYADIGLLGFVFSSALIKNSAVAIVMIAIGGLAVSIAWAFISLTTIRWIHTWRKGVVEIEKSLFQIGPFNHGEALSGDQYHEQWRPEYFSFILPFVFIIIWVWLMLFYRTFT